jgi:hypothetical protein
VSNLIPSRETIAASDPRHDSGGQQSGKLWRKMRWLLFLNFGLACASSLQMERLLWFVGFSFESQCR